MDERERQALEALFECYRNRALKVAVQVSGAYQDIEDIVQEAFLRACRSIGGFRRESSISTWFYQILANVSADSLRKACSDRSVSLDALQEDGAELPGPAEDEPESRAIKRDMLDILRRAMLSLPSMDRAMLWLRAIGGMSYKEISSVMDCSIESVRSRLKRARKQLLLEVNALAPDRA